MAKGMGLALGGFTQGLRQGEDDVRRKKQFKQQQELGELQAEKSGFDLERAKKSAPIQDELNRLRTEKAGFGLERMRTKAQRTDQEYERATDQRAEQEQFDNAMKSFFISRGQNLEPMLGYINERVPGKNNISVERTEDGRFMMTGITEDGQRKPLSPEPMDFDQLGKAFVALQDPASVISQGPPDPVGVSDGETLVDPRTGRVVYDNPKDRSGLGPGGVKTADYNSLKSGIRDMFARMDPEGNIFMPEGSDEEYGKALELGNDLIARDIPIGRATRMAYAAVRGPLSEDEAREKARIEARKQDFGWGEGDKEDAFVEKRAKELMNNSRQALREYEQVVSRDRQPQGRGLPGAATGRQGAPQRQQQSKGAPKRGTIDRSGQTPTSNRSRIQQGGQAQRQQNYPQSGEVRLQGGKALTDPQGTPITWEDVHTTANKHGMTVDQVLQRLRGNK